MSTPLSKKEEVFNASFPFIIIGLLCDGLFFLDNWLSSHSDGLISRYLKYANIDINFAEQAGKIVSEHIAIYNISYLIIFLFFSSALHRLFYGSQTKTPAKKSIIKPVDSFVINLNGAMIGLFLSLMLYSFFEYIFFSGDLITFIKFVFLELVSWVFTCAIFSARSILEEKGVLRNYLFLNKCGDKVEGFIILVLSIVLLTYNTQFANFIHSTEKSFIALF